MAPRVGTAPILARDSTMLDFLQQIFEARMGRDSPITVHLKEAFAQRGRPLRRLVGQEALLGRQGAVGERGRLGLMAGQRPARGPATAALCGVRDVASEATRGAGEVAGMGGNRAGTLGVPVSVGIAVRCGRQCARTRCSETFPRGDEARPPARPGKPSFRLIASTLRRIASGTDTVCVDGVLPCHH